MSEHVTLVPRMPLEGSIQADSIRADVFASLNERDIASLPIWSGRDRRSLGDYFDISGSHSASVRIAGDVRRADGIATGMAGGNLVIDGDAGTRLGAGLAGGRVEVLGNVGDDAGLGMSGGSIQVRKNAGHRVGAATPGASRGMTGGEIVIEGSVGTDVAARMRRGLVFVGGDAQDRAARSIIAGTVIVIGRVGAEPAFASKRGSLVVAGGVDVPQTYRYACDYDAPHVRLALTYLVRRYGLSLGGHLASGRYRRYCGDAGTVARGEILEWIESSFRA